MHPVSQKGVSAVSRERPRVLSLNFQDMLKNAGRLTNPSTISFLAATSSKASVNDFEIAISMKIVEKSKKYASRDDKSPTASGAIHKLPIVYI